MARSMLISLETPPTIYQRHDHSFIFYDWTSNDVLFTPINDAKYETMVKYSKITLIIQIKGVSSLNIISLTMWRKNQYKITLKPRILAPNWWKHTNIGLMQQKGKPRPKKIT